MWMEDYPSSEKGFLRVRMGIMIKNIIYRRVKK